MLSNFGGLEELQLTERGQKTSYHVSAFLDKDSVASLDCFFTHPTAKSLVRNDGIPYEGRFLVASNSYPVEKVINHIKEFVEGK